MPDFITQKLLECNTTLIILLFQRDKELAEKFLLKPADFYNYLNTSGCIKLEGINDADKFDALRLAFEVVQIPPDTIEGILSVMSSILWLGNLKFADTDHEDAALDPTDSELIDTVSRLLGLEYEDLKQVLALLQKGGKNGGPGPLALSGFLTTAMMSFFMLFWKLIVDVNSTTKHWNTDIAYFCFNLLFSFIFRRNP